MFTEDIRFLHEEINLSTQRSLAFPRPSEKALVATSRELPQAAAQALEQTLSGWILKHISPYQESLESKQKTAVISYQIPAPIVPLLT